MKKNKPNQNECTRRKLRSKKVEEERYKSKCVWLIAIAFSCAQLRSPIAAFPCFRFSKLTTKTNSYSHSLPLFISFFLRAPSTPIQIKPTKLLLIIIIFKLFNILMGLKLAHNIYFCMEHALWTLSSFEEPIRFY